MSMNKEILMIVESIAREKDLHTEAVFQALEEALAFAARKKVGGEPKITVEIDRETGEQVVLRHWQVIEQYEEGMNEDQQIMRVDLEPEQEGVSEFTQTLDIDFGRSSAQLAKQAIYQRIRDIEQRAALDDVEDRGEGLLYGTVKSFQKGNAILEIGRLEAILPKAEYLPRDMLKVGSRVRVAIKSVDKVGTRDVVTVSRVTPEFMKLLIAQEVIQVEEGEIEIVKLVRAPGVRCKMIVRSHMRQEESNGRDGNRGRFNDPARIIIGSKGIHAKSIAEETGEHMDIIIESEDTADMVIQALAPAEPSRIRIDEETRVVEAAISEESLGLVIGSKGVNIRLISELLGWNVEVMTEPDWEAKDQEHMQKSLRLFIDRIDMSEDLAVDLVEAGFSNLEEVAFAPIDELLAIDGMEEELAQEIRQRARSYVEARETELRVKYGPAKASLSRIEGITSEEIEQLVKASVFSSDDLADLGTDELLEALPHWRQSRAQSLIMAARAFWAEPAV